MGNLLMVKKNLWKLSKYLIYLKIYLKNITIFSNFWKDEYIESVNPKCLT